MQICGRGLLAVENLHLLWGKHGGRSETDRERPEEVVTNRGAVVWVYLKSSLAQTTSYKVKASRGGGA